MREEFDDLKVAIKKEIADDQSIYKVTDELINYKFDESGVYIPFNQDNYLKLSRNESKKLELIYIWTKYNGNSFQTLTIYRSDKLINEEDKKLITNLLKASESAGLEFNEDELISFVSNFKRSIIQANCLSVLKEVDFEFPKKVEAEEVEEQSPDTISFTDYDKVIQEEAIKMLEEDKLFDNTIDNISWTHEGNKDATNQLALILSSVFIDQPVHTEVNADTGVGKTDIVIETSENYPPCYINIVRNISPRNVYYDRDSYGKYNILIFDDVVLSESMIEVIKELADNKKPVKELRTVIDGKARTFTLEGKFLIILTYAKNNIDEELLNRLYKLNIIVTGKDSKKNIKGKVKTNTIIDSENNEIIKRSRLIIQSAIQYLVEMDINVFNPFTLLFDPSELNNRNIKGFITLVKSKTFFHALNRKSVKIGEKDIYIGSYEDYSFVNELWKKTAKIQEFKLNDKHIRILEYLPEKTHEEAHDQHKKALTKYNDAESKEEKNEILEKEYTRSNISKATGIASSTLRNYLDYPQGTAKSLEDMGLIGKILFDKDSSSSSPWIYYKIKEGDKKRSCVGCEIKNSNQINSLNFKQTVLYSLFMLCNITLNEEGWAYLNFYCENYSNELDINDYNSYYNFINVAVSNFNYDKYSVNLDKAKYNDLSYVKDIGSELKNSKILNINPTSSEFHTPTKASKNTVFEKQSSKKGANLDITTNTGTMKNPELARNIGLCLIKGNLTAKQLTDEIHENYNTDDTSIDFLSIAVGKCINDLLNSQLVLENKVDDETYYRASDDFKKLLGDG
ncbi:MAG: hypothetical protein ACI389_06185 [Methanobrevibacter sp.]|uniref:hypothetical protein n=1 Tax=Methanobrevibacter sp. TaxID=66852 RepID=UPI003F00AEB6